MIGVAWWQAILNGLGQLLAWIYAIVPNYAVAIVILTLLIRVVLLPLGFKQIRSMQSMQAIQPQLKEVQRKYKADRQKQYEETQKLYKEYGVNPLSGCLPMLLQFPVLIALFAVLRVPGGIVHIPHQHLANGKLPAPGPGNSRLYNDIAQQDTHIKLLGANLLCSATQAGKQVTVELKTGESSSLVKQANGKPVLDCGHGVPVRIPFYVLAAVMIASQWYQQRQMTKASPPGANQQQQQLTRIMPLLFGIWGFIFPAGLVVYWTTTNLVQIGQQHFLLPKRVDEDGEPQPPAKPARGNGGRPARRPGRPGTQGPRGGASKPGSSSGKSSGSSGGSAAGRRGALEGLRGRPGSGGGSRGNSGGPSTSGGRGGSASGGGGTGGGDRKKRRKR